MTRFSTADRLEALYDAVPDGIVISDADDMVVSANSSAERMFGFGPGTMFGLPVTRLIPSSGVGRRLHVQARKSDGSIFPADIQQVLLGDGHLRVLVSTVRDASDNYDAESLLLAIGELNRALLASLSVREIYRLVARLGRELLGAALSTIAVPSARPGHMVIAGADSEDLSYLVGLELEPGSSAAGRCFSSGHSMRIADLSRTEDVHPDSSVLGLGPAMLLPLRSEETAIGVLSLARWAGGPAYTSDEQSLAEAFANAVAAVILTDRANNEAAKNIFARDRQRIAHHLSEIAVGDLEDIRAVLESLDGGLSDEVRTRLGESVAAIVAAIANLRTVAGELAAAESRTVPVTPFLDRLLDSAEMDLGFRPSLMVEGPIDSSVSPEVRAALLEAMGEVVHKIACHSMATEVQIEVTADAFSLVLSIRDDGVGIPEGPATARWLNALARQAREMDGELSVIERRPTGFLYEWRVPLDR